MPLGRSPIVRRSLQPSNTPPAPPHLMWSMMLRPTCPLELPIPELSRMRALSSADAHRKITRALYSRSAFVLASITRTPDTRPMVSTRAPERSGDPLAHVLLDAIQRHRRQKLAGGELREAFGLTAHPDEALDAIVPGRDVRVADRPIDRDAVAHVGLEIEIAPAVDLASPDDRLAADLPGAKPVERSIGRRAVGVVDIVGPEDVTQFVERDRMTLHRLTRGDRAAIAQSPERHLPGRFVLGVIPFGHNRPPGFEHERAQAELGQLFRRPAARHAGTNDDGVKIGHTGAHPSYRHGSGYSLSA